MVLQEVIPDKLWIVTDKQQKVGTLRVAPSGYEFYDERTHKKTILQSLQAFESKDSQDYESDDLIVNGYPSKHYPYPATHDVLPVYRRSKTGKSIHAAGYYVVKFDGMGWQWAFSPKLDTLEKYSFKGPFMTEWEMNLELKRLKRASN